MRNINVKEEIIERKSTFIVIIIIIMRNVAWIANNVEYMWIQEGP
jgi:hypothetical protein